MKEALKLALEALECALSDDKPYIVKSKEAITAIKAALAQECPNLKNCKGACFQCEYFNVDTGMMEYPAAQPAQEPITVLTSAGYIADEDDDIQVYQRPWVGLTEAQFLEATRLAENGNYLVAFVRIQEWLKEQNT
jgi:hypothetical protein